MQDLKVAIIQTKQFWEDKARNLAHFENTYLNELKGQEIDLLLLPEMFNSSFTMNVEAMAEAMDGDSITWLFNWATELNCQIGASLIIYENGRYYNRFVIVSENGIETYYDKRHLFRMANENDHFEAGSQRVLHTIRGWKILLQVCYDLRFPVFSRNRTIEGKKEYDLVIYVANWPERRNYVWKTLLLARAMENQAYCIGVNRVGTDGNDITYTGDSAVVDPWGKIQYQFNSSEEAYKIVSLDYKILEDITEKFPAYKDADPLV
ncbi:MAG: amidohydrolase [Crocinitomicaceae bacterium]|nr:amidohydrolase [Crocinitomicaceae bacterium]